MKTKRSMWLILLCAAGAGLLVTNCTIKTDDDPDDGNGCTPGATRTGCECADKSEGFQVCSSSGVYGGCECSPANQAGASNAGGGGSAGETSGAAGEGGAVSVAGAGGEGGEAGGLNIDPLDCYDCLTKLCAQEWDVCISEDENNPPTPGNYCLSSSGDGSGQIEAIMSCITELRAKGTAKREAVRSCGATLGASSDPTTLDWPPLDMTPGTEAVMNCMADAPDETMVGAWASDEVLTTPWVDMTCAKLACTSQLL